MEARTLNEIARAMQDADGVHECGRENTHTQGWYRNLATAALAVVQPELDRLRNLVAILQQQAEIHAQEARTANATIYEAYQAVTGATGEPGNWNGAQPIRDELDRLRAENARLRSALEPFASRAGRYDPVDNDDGEPDWSTAAPSIRIGDLRRARAALSPSPADGEGR